MLNSGNALTGGLARLIDKEWAMKCYKVATGVGNSDAKFKYGVCFAHG
jgi:hypothetical protein